MRFDFSRTLASFSLLSLALIVGVIFLICYVVKSMRDHNTYLRDIRDELRKRLE